MAHIFFQLVPFFLIIGCGYAAVVSRLITDEGIKYLTRFVFYFPLSAMLFDFSSKLPVSTLFDGDAAIAYVGATLVVFLIATVVARMRGCDMQESAIEAQCCAVGNTGFLGLPILIMLFGVQAAAPVLLVLTMDLVVFGTLVVAVITAGRSRMSGPSALWTILRGLFSNPMIIAIVLGLCWSVWDLPRPVMLVSYLEIMGAAATPCALFAIGGSLAEQIAERLSVAVWISLAKLVLHPLAVACATLYVFALDPFPAAVMIACAAMPTAGNIYMLARHYNVAPQRVSASILVSTASSVLSLTLAIGLVSGITGMS